MYIYVISRSVITVPPSGMGATGLYYTVLNYTILYYTILYYTILYYTILYYTILYYTMLYYAILCYSILYHGARRPRKYKAVGNFPHRGGPYTDIRYTHMTYLYPHDIYISIYIPYTHMISIYV